jgi:hypothetical protein
LKDIHEQKVRDAQQAARKQRADRRSALVWELRRHAGALLKLLRALRNVG